MQGGVKKITILDQYLAYLGTATRLLLLLLLKM